jgi:hypothetical protein
MSRIYRGQFGLRGDLAEPGDWQDAVDALHDLARSSQRPPLRDVSPPSEQGSAKSPDVDGAIDALQALARKYGAQFDADHATGQPAERSPGTQSPEPLRVLVRARRRRTLKAMALVGIATAALLLLFAASRFANPPYWEWAGSLFGRQAAVPVAAPASAPAPAPVSPKADLRWIERAMVDCDREAAHDPDALYFFIIPVMPGTKDFQSWSPIAAGQGGHSILLLRSKDMLDGLQDGSLSLYPGRYTFAISDPSGNDRHIWSPSVGLTKLTDRDAPTMSRFSVAFSLADDLPQMQMGFGFAREKGVCYWVTALVAN